MMIIVMIMMTIITYFLNLYIETIFRSFVCPFLDQFIGPEIIRKTSLPWQANANFMECFLLLSLGFSASRCLRDGSAHMLMVVVNQAVPCLLTGCNSTGDCSNLWPSSRWTFENSCGHLILIQTHQWKEMRKRLRRLNRSTDRPLHF